jgi:hypothetical protein
MNDSGKGRAARIRAARSAEEYKQSRADKDRKEYNTGYNAALEDVELLLQTRINGLQASYNQNPVLPVLKVEAELIKTRIQTLRQAVPCEMCGKPIKWLVCAETECSGSKEG